VPTVTGDTYIRPVWTNTASQTTRTTWLPVTAGTGSGDALDALRFAYEGFRVSANATTASTTYTGGQDWVWGAQSALTGQQWQRLNDKYEAVRITRAQRDLQRANGIAMAWGNQLRPFNEDWFAANLDDPLDEHAMQVVLATYARTYAAAERNQLERLEREARREEAQRRAEMLLQSLLSVEQKREWLEHRYVTEQAPSGRWWRFYPIVSGGSVLLNEDRTARRATLCVHPRGEMPPVDIIVALLLTLRSGNEIEMLGRANVHSGFLNPEEQEIARLGHEIITARRLAAIGPPTERVQALLDEVQDDEEVAV
jgi:hypothetical protein